MRNLEYPLDWDAVFAYVGEHGFLKPIDGGGWRDVYHVHNREEFFQAYDQSRDLCMMYQKAVDFTEYFRCYVVGQKKVRIMPYDPRRPHEERYLKNPPKLSRLLRWHVEQDALKLCSALGYDLNTVEFAVENGIPYAIDFMNPVPDADLNSVGEANFAWIVRAVANMAIAKAKTAPHVPELRWSAFLGTNVAKAKAARKKPASKRGVGKRAVKAAGTMAKKNSKLVVDEEAMAADAEPMGSVAGAVARDQGSSAAAMKAEPPKPDAKDTETKRTPPSA
jgi:hypothetical protein